MGYACFTFPLLGFNLPELPNYSTFEESVLENNLICMLIWVKFKDMERWYFNKIGYFKLLHRNFRFAFNIHILSYNVVILLI